MPTIGSGGKILSPVPDYGKGGCRKMTALFYLLAGLFTGKLLSIAASGTGSVDRRGSTHAKVSLMSRRQQIRAIHTTRLVLRSGGLVNDLSRATPQRSQIAAFANEFLDSTGTASQAGTNDSHGTTKLGTAYPATESGTKPSRAKSFGRSCGSSSLLSRPTEKLG